MELRINLATASLKDAEHAIFLIGAYFGLTQAAVGDVRITAPVAVNFTSDPKASAPVVPVGLGNIPASVLPAAGADAYLAGITARNEPQADPATVFAPPAALPPEAGESPMTADPAAVFAGNVATAPAGQPGSPVAGPSAQLAAAVGAGEAGNVAGAVVAPAGSPSPGMQAPAPSPSVAPAGVELDADGLPWDARINASGEGGGKPINADGRWRKKRGLNDAALVARVQAELRATMAAGALSAGGVVIPPPPVAALNAAPTLPAGAVVLPSPAPAPLPTPPVAASTVPQTFEQLMPRITAAVGAGTIPRDALLQAVTAYNLPTIVSLAQRPDMVPAVWALLQATYPTLA